MGTILLFSLLIIFLAVILLGIRVFFTKNGKFPNIHISGNKALNKKGIHCASCEEEHHTQLK